MGKTIMEIPIIELFPPEFHPFQVNDDEAMTRLAENIKRHGVREPGIARPREDGGYELLSGNRRKRACEIAGIKAMPVIIHHLDDDSATILMVDSNLEHRDRLLYSEKAWAYRVKLEALNHNGVKGDMLSVDILVEQTGESKSQIFRLVRLTELVPVLLDKVDAGQLAFNPAVELSYLTRKEQAGVVEAMAKYEIKPSLSQAQHLKKLSQAGELACGEIDAILSVVKKPPGSKKKGSRCFREYFPSGYSEKQMDEVIIGLLTAWKEKLAG
jgi:ParB family chromosome partitioning protein